MTHKERMLKAARGQTPDRLPYAPRIDLWFYANKVRGTLPDPYKDAEGPDEIAVSEGWALHKVVLEYMHTGLDAIIDRVLGVYRIPAQGFLSRLPADVERRVQKSGDDIRVEYRTVRGTVSGTFVYTEAMRQSGISIPWIKEHLLKEPADYDAIGYIFEHMQVEPAYDGYLHWAESIGENGMPVMYALTAGSPMHHIMKILVDATDFYYRHRDQERLMLGLAEKIGVYYRKVYDLVARSPAEVALIGANFDDMLTYPPFFKDHIMPWLQEASEKLHPHGKRMLCHTDGENKGLMDLLLYCGMDIAEAVCPYPMTKVGIAEYYRRWSKKITIFGGIPSNILLADMTSDDAFEAYMTDLFQAISPGSRFILGVADATPPDASFERLRRIHALVQENGQIPIQAAKRTPPSVPEEDVPKALVSGPKPMMTSLSDDIPNCKDIRDSVLAGDRNRTMNLVSESIETGADPDKLLKNCLLPPMDIIGDRFTDGTVFIPEVLLSARALNESMALIEPLLEKKKDSDKDRPLVLLGTVKGDLHDIGKNLVGIMFRSVGLRVYDLGINIDVKTFVEAVEIHRPAVLALSALLTTTMSEFKKVIDALAGAGLRNSVKVMVGGAPVSDHFAESIGADGYGADAGEAAQKAKQLCGITNRRLCPN